MLKQNKCRCAMVPQNPSPQLALRAGLVVAAAKLVSKLLSLLGSALLAVGWNPVLSLGWPAVSLHKRLNQPKQADNLLHDRTSGIPAARGYLQCM